jgi:hypothetical protein
VVDYLDLAANGIITFLAVVLGYFLAVRQDRLRDKREDADKKAALMTLFENELSEISDFLEEKGSDAEFPFLYDVWDSAKASGELSLLKTKEFEILSQIYIDLRALNHRVDEYLWLARARMDHPLPDLDSRAAALHTKILANRMGLRKKIISGQETLKLGRYGERKFPEST